MTIKVTKDKVDDVLKAVRSLTKTEILVGVPEESANRGDDAEINNAQVGYINEFGSPANNIPQRPHLVPGVASVKDKVATQLLKAARLAIDGEGDKVTQQQVKVGTTAVSAVKAKITAGLSPGLSPVTIYKRQHRKTAPRMGDKPLIDTGDYLKSIKFVIRGKGK